VALAAAFEALHQESHKLDGLFLVFIDDNGFDLLLLRVRKGYLFVCHSFSPFLDVMERRQAAPRKVVEILATGPWLWWPVLILSQYWGTAGR
jgi:hypothetical protein